MNLFNDESILLSNDSNTVLLTTHRIRSDFGDSSDSSLTSIMLENVSSVRLNSTSHPALLNFGALICLIGLGVLAFGQRESKVYGGLILIVGIIFVALYYYSRKHICIIASNGGSSIIFSTTNMKREALVDFIDKVEEAKVERLNRLRSY